MGPRQCRPESFWAWILVMAACSFATAMYSFRSGRLQKAYATRREPPSAGRKVVYGDTIGPLEGRPFPQAFLRINGLDVTRHEDAGSGVVNCQYYGPGFLQAPSLYPQNNSSDFELRAT
jgi:hypothetical protein